MKLFENKVGRPSNEILKKRKLFKIGTIFASIAIITASFCLGYFGTERLKGSVATITVSNSPKAGDKVVLSGTPIYGSSSIKTKAGNKTGEY